jgi:nitroreductase
MNRMLETIRERRSERVPFDPARPVAKEDLRQILEAARWAPTAHNMQNFQMVIVDDRQLLLEIANITYSLSETFIRENYEQLSFSEEDFLKKKTGLLGAMLPPALRTPKVSADEAIPNAFLGNSIRTAPVLLVVLYDPRKRSPASEGDFLGIVSLGCVMENMWLMAETLGIGFHVLSALKEGGEEKIKTMLAIPEHLRIAFGCRLGYPVPPPAKYLRVRRDVTEFSYRNRFGNAVE